MKAGTWVVLSDGRKGTVTYNGLDGVGIVWGHMELDDEEVAWLCGSQPLFGKTEVPPDAEHLVPVAMLRKSYPSAWIECVGADYEVTKEGKGCP